MNEKLSSEPMLKRSRWSCLMCLGLVSFLTATAGAAITWPSTSAEWIAVTTGGGASFYDDPDDTNPASTDIEGDATFAALYWYYQDKGTPLDESDDELLFRIRLDDDANNPQVAWQILLNTDADIYLDYVLEYDTSGNPDIVEFAPTGGNQATVADVTFDTANLLWSSTTVNDFTRIIAADDGSNFDGDPDVFVDIGIPWVDFSAGTGLSTSDSFSFGASTSTTGQSINKDVPLGLTDSANVASLLGDAVVVVIPEPSSLSLTALAAGFIWRRRRK